MTLTQIVIIVAGLFVGYKLVSLMLSPGDGSKATRSKPGSDDAATSPDESGANGSPGSGGSPPPETPWYQILGVSESAGQAEIDRAYRVQISQYHPDKVANLGADIRRLADERSKAINGAYETAAKSRRR